MRPIFEKGFGSQLMLPLGGSTRQQMLLYIEDKAKKILVVDEYNAVIRHIKQVCHFGVCVMYESTVREPLEN